MSGKVFTGRIVEPSQTVETPAVLTAPPMTSRGRMMVLPPPIRPQSPFVYEVKSDGQTVRLEAPTLDGLKDLMRAAGVGPTIDPRSLQ